MHVDSTLASADAATLMARHAGGLSLKPKAVSFKQDNTFNEARARKVSQDFEAVFVRKMIKEMRGTTMEEGGLFGNSPASRMYRGMFDEELANTVTKAGGIGLSEIIYEDIRRQAENLSEVPEDVKTRFGTQAQPLPDESGAAPLPGRGTVDVQPLPPQGAVNWSPLNVNGTRPLPAGEAQQGNDEGENHGTAGE